MTIDPNKRLDPYTQQTTITPTSTPQRIVHVALPFLALYAPAQKVVTIYVALEHSWTIINGDASVSSKLFNLTICTARAASAILYPSVTSFAVTLVSIGSSSWQMLVCLKNQDLKGASQHLLSLVSSTIYLGSFVIGSRELIFVSLLAQAVKELYIAYSEFQKNGRNLESVAALLMAIIRLSQARVHGAAIQRYYFGKPLTQSDLNAILESIQKTNSENPEQKIDFDALLKQDNFSNRITDLKFTDSENQKYQNIDFKEIDFNDCSFTSITIADSTFTRVQFNSTTFQQAAFDNCNFLFSSFSNFTSMHNTFVNTNFFRSYFDESHFVYNDIINTRFIETRFEDSLIHHVTFDTAMWINSTIWNTGINSNKIVNSGFENTSITDSSFVRSIFSNVSFKHSQTPYVAFNNATMENVSFTNCALKGTSFLESTVTSATLDECDLTDTIFAGTEDAFVITGGIPQHFTGPVIGIRWDFNGIGSYTYAEYEAVKETGGIPLLFDAVGDWASIEHLDSEVEARLSEIASQGLPEGTTSIAQAILQYAPAGSGIDYVNQRAANITKYIQGLLIPGGLDVDPRFYGQTRQEEIHVDKSHARTIVEFAVIAEADKRELPILAICRGSQVYNVFHGGTLKQHIDNHSDLDHQLTIDPAADPRVAEIMRGIIGEGTEGYSNHHQALDKVADNLHVVIRHEGDVEASMTLDGRVIVLQFHPEKYIFERFFAAIRLSFKTYPHHKGRHFFQNLVAKAQNYAATEA